MQPPPDAEAPQPSPRETIAFLCLADSIERLDTLILETRHTQVNIIHQLRLPELYRLLRFEEQFLWGEWQELDHGQSRADESDKKAVREGSWDKLFTDRAFSARTCAEAALIRFPPPTGDPNLKAFGRPQDFVGYPGIDWKTREAIVRAAALAVARLWSSGTWSMTQKRQYRLLSVLQQIKRDMFRDKLEVCRQGMEPFRGGCPGAPSRNRAIGRFLLFRSAVQGRIHRYVERIGDLQGQFERDLDMGLRDQPRPLIGRRREQGIYTGFLSDYCRDLYKEANLLLAHLGVRQPEIPMELMHRWRHDFTSHNWPYRTECRRHQPRDDEDGNRIKDRAVQIGFVNSSYWMIERPDLQPILAHEIAHLCLSEHYEELYADSLAPATDRFATLLRNIMHCIKRSDTASQEPASDEPIQGADRYARMLTLEIAADLIATAVLGPAYLLAMTLELLGAGLEELFRQPDDRIDLELIDWIDRRGHNGLIDQGRDWYLRLTVACAWCDAVQHRPAETSRLEQLLIEGTRDVCEALSQQLASLRRVPPEADHYWRALGKRLCAIVEVSDAAAGAQDWRDDRGRDFEQEDKTGPRLLPRSTRRLPDEVRNLLLERTIAFKASDLRPSDEMANPTPKQRLHGIRNRYQACRAFDQLYLARRFECPRDCDNKQPEIQVGNRPLFQHHYDIPWQCAIARGIDFVTPDFALDTALKSRAFTIATWPLELHHHASFGRELYQIALEFHFWRARSSFQRLSLVFDLLSDALHFRLNSLQSEIQHGRIRGLVSWLVGQELLSQDIKEGKELKGTVRWIHESAKCHDQSSKHVFQSVRKLAEEFKNLFADYQNGLFGDRKAFRERASEIAENTPAIAFFAVHPQSSHSACFTVSEDDRECFKVKEGEEQCFLEKLQGYKLDQLYRRSKWC